MDGVTLRVDNLQVKLCDVYVGMPTKDLARHCHHPIWPRLALLCSVWPHLAPIWPRVRGKFIGIFGYSDDNWLLAPSLPALQDMLKTCQEYAEAHNLQFSTDPDPRKCKTKCMAFLRKQRELLSMMLCNSTLPWVDKLVHLGNTVAGDSLT